MIAGNTSNPFRAAAHISQRIDHAMCSKRWFVWLDGDRVCYCNEDSKKIFNERDLVGTYVKRRHDDMQFTLTQIMEDIQASESEKYRGGTIG